MKSEELYAKEDLNTMNSGERKTGVDVSRTETEKPGKHIHEK